MDRRAVPDQELARVIGEIHFALTTAGFRLESGKWASRETIGGIAVGPAADLRRRIESPTPWTTFRDAHRPNLAEGEQDRLCATALQELRDRVARLHAKLEKEPDLCEILLDVLRTPSNVGGGRSPGVHGHRAPWRTPESLAVILAAHVLDLDATRIRRRVRFNPKDQEGRKMKNHIVVGRFQEDEQD